MRREVSLFAATGRAGEPSDDAGGELPIDEARMERAMEALAGDAGKLDENDPRQAAELMRKFSKMTGMKFGESVEEAIDRMEAGEDPESIEQELGSRIEQEEPFSLPEGAAAAARRRRKMRPPEHDAKLYDL